MEALFFLAGGVVCAVRMEQVARIHARAEARVTGNSVVFGDDPPLRQIDLPRLLAPGPRRLLPGAGFLRLEPLPGRALKVERLLTRTAVAPTRIHLLPPHVFQPEQRWFSHLVDQGEFCAFLIDAERLRERA